jgi:undecaprenyl diphosphate synthase
MSTIDKLKLDISSNPIPKHVAVIMDGNGRWAMGRRQTRLFGHKSGVEAIRNLLEISVEIGLKYLTIYAFSTENWTRPKDEISGLLKLILDSLIKEIDEMSKNNVVVRFIGSEENLPAGYKTKIIEECKKSWNNTGLNFNIAMNYGGRAEILDAIKNIIPLMTNGSLKPEDLDEKTFESYLLTAGMPEPDLMIRTSGEKRLSNFLIWQSAYTELYFTDVLWPDFKKETFLEAIIEYQNRIRRFGGIN